MALIFTVVETKRVELVPGNEILNIDLRVSYAEFLSMTKHLVKPYKAHFELPDGEVIERNVGFAKGVEANANARITMRNFDGDIPEGTTVTLLE
ncbi:MAG: hypothetical protein KF696_06550 [Planctomycetes bacterium]|nr:hypothetical protein [Planctomycetota bacterium]MCW8137215.1 hypothetical protein [Planctomycetota bacterium]